MTQSEKNGKMFRWIEYFDYREWSISVYLLSTIQFWNNGAAGFVGSIVQRLKTFAKHDPECTWLMVIALQS